MNYGLHVKLTRTFSTVEKNIGFQVGMLGIRYFLYNVLINTFYRRNQ